MRDLVVSNSELIYLNVRKYNYVSLKKSWRCNNYITWR